MISDVPFEQVHPPMGRREARVGQKTKEPVSVVGIKVAGFLQNSGEEAESPTGNLGAAEHVRVGRIQEASWSDGSRRRGIGGEVRGGVLASCKKGLSECSSRRALLSVCSEFSAGSAVLRFGCALLRVSSRPFLFTWSDREREKERERERGCAR